MDERSSDNIVKAMGITLAILYLVILFSALYQYISSGDIYRITNELILIVMIPALVAWFGRKDESLMLPRNLQGEPLAESESVEDRQKRRRHYFLESLAFATFCIVASLLDGWLIQKEWDYFIFSEEWSISANIILSYVIDYLIMLIIFTVIAYIWGEYSIRKYNKALKELEETS